MLNIRLHVIFLSRCCIFFRVFFIPRRWWERKHFSSHLWLLSAIKTTFQCIWSCVLRILDIWWSEEREWYWILFSLLRWSRPCWWSTLNNSLSLMFGEREQQECLFCKDIQTNKMPVTVPWSRKDHFIEVIGWMNSFIRIKGLNRRESIVGSGRENDMPKSISLFVVIRGLWSKWTSNTV